MIVAMASLSYLLFKIIRLVQAQHLKEFAWHINTQTIAFLNVWSIAAYAVVATASRAADPPVEPIVRGLFVGHVDPAPDEVCIPLPR